MGVNGGTIGGAMVKRMIEQAEREMEEANHMRKAAAHPKEDEDEKEEPEVEVLRAVDEVRQKTADWWKDGCGDVGRHVRD